MNSRWTKPFKSILRCAKTRDSYRSRHTRGLATFTNPPSSGITPLNNRRLLAVTGKDAPKLLQGLITNNIDSLLESDKPGFYTALLNSHGRLLTDAFIYRIPSKSGSGLVDGFWLEVEESLVATLGQYLRRHKLRSAVKIEPLDAAEYKILVSWGSGLPPSAFDASSEVLHLADPRLPDFADRFVVPATSSRDQSLYKQVASLPAADPRDYLARRCAWGLTEGHQAMVSGRSLPHEFNFDVLNAIDFHKGCYIGQELTIRTQHQGVVRKRILPLAAYSKDGDTPSTPTIKDSKGIDTETIQLDTKIVRLTSDPSAPKRRNNAAATWVEGIANIGLGLCRLETMTDVKISADQDATSFSPEAEFGFEQDESGIKVKAFVPDWLRGRIGPRKPRTLEQQEDI